MHGQNHIKNTEIIFYNYVKLTVKLIMATSDVHKT